MELKGHFFSFSTKKRPEPKRLGANKIRGTTRISPDGDTLTPNNGGDPSASTGALKKVPVPAEAPGRLPPALHRTLHQAGPSLRIRRRRTTSPHSHIPVQYIRRKAVCQGQKSGQKADA